MKKSYFICIFMILSAFSAVFAGPYSSDPGYRAITGTVKGLMLLIDFPDIPASTVLTRSEFENFANLSGYNNFSCIGSVRDYYLSASGGRLDLSYVVPEYYTALQPHTYYDQGGKPNELLLEALNHLQADGFDFTQITTDNANNMLAVAMVCAGQGTGYPGGLFPHKAELADGAFCSAGTCVKAYAITDMAMNKPWYGTFIHENGHSVFRWPDLYGVPGFAGGVGVYCIMGTGSTNRPIPNPFYREKAGWLTYKEIDSTSAGRVTITANSDEVYRYRNPLNSNEYYLIEAGMKNGYRNLFPDEGLMLWHIDELGDNYSMTNMLPTPSKHHKVLLVQADGLQELEKDTNDGNAGDLFKAAGVSCVTGLTWPETKWWDGSQSGLIIQDVSAPGMNMAFSLGAAGSVYALPGRVEAEGYRPGAEGYAYHDNTTGNSGGAFRTDDVDIEACLDAGGGYDVMLETGEWTSYNVDLNAAYGYYNLVLRVASGSPGTKTIRIEAGCKVLAEVNYTGSSGGQNWENIAVNNVYIGSGRQAIKVSCVAGPISLNYIDMQEMSVTPTFTPTPVFTPSFTMIDDFEDNEFNNNTLGGPWTSAGLGSLGLTRYMRTSPAQGNYSGDLRVSIPMGSFYGSSGFETYFDAAKTPYDVNNLTGLSLYYGFSANSNNISGYTVTVKLLTAGITDNSFLSYNSFSTYTYWGQINIPWSSFTKPGIGQGGAMTRQEMLGKIYGIRIEVNVMNGAATNMYGVDIGFDNIQFYYATPTNTATATQTPTYTYTATATDTVQDPTFTSSATATSSHTATASFSPSETATNTGTAALTFTHTYTATATNTQSSSQTPTYTQTAASTATHTASATESSTAYMTFTHTNTAASTPSYTPTATGTDTQNPTYTASGTATQSHTATTASTATYTPTHTFTATQTGTAGATRTFTQTPTNTTVFTPTFTRTATASNTASMTFTNTYTGTWTNTATATHTFTETQTYSGTPTATDTQTAATSTPTYTNTPAVTATPTESDVFEFPPDKPVIVFPHPAKAGQDCWIQFDITKKADSGSVRIYTYAYRLVREISIAEPIYAGTNTVRLKGVHTREFSSGGYYYIISARSGGSEARTKIQKLMILR